MTTDPAIEKLLAKFAPKLQVSELAPDTDTISSGAQIVKTSLDLLNASEILNSAEHSNIVQPSLIGTTNPAPLSAADQIVARISKLQEMLQVQSPGYESLLHEIHVTLFKDQALTHLLTEEQIGVIVAGLSKKKNIVIAAGMSKAKKKAADISVDDI